jgi:hypothetical protein
MGLNVTKISVTRFVIVAIAGGPLFGILDALINANPLARDLFVVYEPIAKTSVNMVAGILIDLIYGFALAGLFMVLYRSLPGRDDLAKGLSFGVMIWFLRVLMSVLSTWMMFELPGSLLLYTLFAGLAEMLVLGIFFALTLRPAQVSR